jgi:hypothetical protein
MANKRKRESAAISDKMEKTAVQDKDVVSYPKAESEAPKEELIDWNSLPQEVTIKAIVSNKHLKEGKVYKCGKDSAFRLVKSKLAILVK